MAKKGERLDGCIDRTMVSSKAAMHNRLREEYGCFYCPKINSCDPTTGCFRLKHNLGRPTQETLDALELKEDL